MWILERKIEKVDITKSYGGVVHSKARDTLILMLKLLCAARIDHSSIPETTSPSQLGLIQDSELDLYLLKQEDRFVLY
jgi:hypothetical protein